jgi:hypothetical protein
VQSDAAQNQEKVPKLD